VRRLISSQKLAWFCLSWSVGTPDFPNIMIHEHPLPQNIIEAITAIFELSISEDFAVYRDTTWRIIATLAMSNTTEGSGEPKVELKRYSGVNRHSNGVVSDFCLASTTKPFLITHYRGISFPVTLDQVCKPNGKPTIFHKPTAG
jgi:hypothetical protein